MSSVGGVAAAVIAAAVAVCGGRSAFADETADGADAKHLLLFSGFDLWRAGSFAHGGLLWSPGGLGREGFTFKLLIAGGEYRYRSGANEITGRQALAAAMPGWRFVREHTEFTIYAGVDLQSHRFSPDDPLNKLRGGHAGLRVGADLWSEPVDGFMLTASTSASTIGGNVWSRAAVGWRVFGGFWIGPEIEVFGEGHYKELRAGAHVTAFRTGPLEWSAGVGYAIDTDHRAGAYGRVGLLARQ